MSSERMYQKKKSRALVPNSVLSTSATALSSAGHSTPNKTISRVGRSYLTERVCVKMSRRPRVPQDAVRRASEQVANHLVGPKTTEYDMAHFRGPCSDDVHGVVSIENGIAWGS